MVHTVSQSARGTQLNGKKNLHSVCKPLFKTCKVECGLLRMAHNKAQKAVCSAHENVYAQYINSSTQNYTLEHKYKQKVGTEQKQTKTVSR